MSDVKKPAAAPKAQAANWRELLSQGETKANEVLNQAMRTQAFAVAFGLAGALVFGLRKVVGETMPKVLAVAQVPSREEIQAISVQLAALEERLIRVSDALGVQSVAPAAAVARPPKTRKPRPPAGLAAPASTALPVAAPAPVAAVAAAPARKRATRPRTKTARAAAGGTTP
jgi:hypothetical protein